MSVEESIKVVEVTALEIEPPIVMDAQTPLRDILIQMRERQYGCAVITRDDKLVGIFTERDVLLRVLGKEGILERPVSEVMTADPVCVGPDDPIRRAAFHMRHEDCRHVPVVEEGGKVVTCVRHKDIIRYLMEHFAQHALNVPPDPDQMATTREGG